MEAELELKMGAEWEYLHSIRTRGDSMKWNLIGAEWNLNCNCIGTNLELNSSNPKP